jgi:LytS/YehU family sensor histidine kinase
METFTMHRILDQKRLTSHLLILGISVFIPLISYIIKPGSDFPGHQISFFILLFIQLELFIFAAGLIFNRPALNIQPTRRDITRTVLFRFGLFLVCCFLIALIVILLFLYAEHMITGAGPSNTFYYFFHNEFKMWSKGTILGFVFAIALFIFIQWQSALKREQKLREENLIFQNETLKSQVNPHFLFNCMNTLSALVGAQPEMAEKFIQKLSSIYRYILENGTRDRVPLKAEVDFIQDYFFLHKIRDDGKINLEVVVNELDKYEILPVSLQILVENAIKHNKATIEEPLHISVFIEDDMIVIKNNLQRMATQIKSTGIGLKNLAERVRLICGRDLVIEETNDYFQVKVPLLS